MKMSIEIREVNNKKEIKNFLNFPLKLYKNNPCYVPPLYGDEKKMFSKNYMYYDQAEAKFFNAYKNGKMVGRIQAIYQKAANKKWNQKRVRFTRFDSINDQEVANALFKAVEDYAKSLGMNQVVGPLGFSDLDREGLLIDGFDQLNTFEEQYNFDYYPKLIDNLGYKKEVDWIEHRIYPTKEKFEGHIKACDKLLDKTGFKVIEGLTYKQFQNRYKDQFFKILDDSYDKLYGTVPFTPGMKELLINNFAPLINMNYLIAVVDKDDKIKGFSISFPAISDIMKKSNGHLYPLTIVKLLKTVKHPKRIDFGLIGGDPTDKISFAVPIVLGTIGKRLLKDNIEYCETNLNLEDNDSINNIWKHFDHIQHKRRRSYIKNIK